MSDDPFLLRRWLLLTDATKRLMHLLRCDEATAQEKILLAIKDEITAARGSFEDLDNDRILIEQIGYHHFRNGTVIWDKNKVVFDNPIYMRHGQQYPFYDADEVEIDWSLLLEKFKSLGPSEGEKEGNDLASREIPDHLRTGYQGRPSIKTFILRHFRSRAESKLVLPTLSEEAAALRDWAAHTYPESPTPTARTIENHIRDEFRQLPRPD